MFKSNEQFEQFSLNLAKTFHAESHGKISPKKNFVSSCLAKAMLDKPEGYNVNTLKAELNQKQESEQAASHQATSHPEIRFNEAIVSELHAFIETDFFFSRLKSIIKEHLDVELDERFFDYLNEEGEIGEFYSDRLAFTESDSDYYRIYDSMHGSQLEYYVNNAASRLDIDTSKPFNDIRIEVNKFAFKDIVEDKLLEWLEFLATDLNDELDQGFPSEKIKAVFESSNDMGENDVELLEQLKEHLKLNALSLHISNE